jgi:hypothetical protein
VATGWGFTRNFANIILIFGLVLIALSIIMGYQETRAKKTLVNFILIAALINFTPVIAGLVIDLAQMLMNLFLKGGVALNFVDLINSKMSGLSVADLPTLIVLCLFCIFAAAVYFIFALLFLARIVMLWILIIVSPIAFAEKVMPDEVRNFTRHILPGMMSWDEWWNQFLQWCFVGIPASFSIWLSNILMQAMSADTNFFSTPSGDTMVGLGPIIMYLVPFLVLVNGLFMSLDSGGAAGSKLKSIAGKTWAATGGAAIGAATGYVAGRAKAGGTWVKEGAIGTGGAILKGKNPLDYENREEGRENWKKFKKETGDTLRKTPVIGGVMPKSKEWKQTESYGRVKGLNKASASELKKNLEGMSDVQKRHLQERFLANETRYEAKLQEYKNKLAEAKSLGDPETTKLAQKELEAYSKKLAMLKYYTGITEKRAQGGLQPPVEKEPGFISKKIQSVKTAGSSVGSKIKGGAAGTAGAVLKGKSPLSFENREEGRKNWEKTKKSAKELPDKLRAAPVIGRVVPKSKEWKQTESYARLQGLRRATIPEMKTNLENMSDIRKKRLKERYLANLQQFIDKANELEKKARLLEEEGKDKYAINAARKELQDYANKIALLEYYTGISEESEFWNRPSFGQYPPEHTPTEN